MTSRSVPCTPVRPSASELSQYWRDVLTPASASDETCGSILNSLKTLNQAVGNTG